MRRRLFSIGNGCLYLLVLLGIQFCAHFILFDTPSSSLSRLSPNNNNYDAPQPISIISSQEVNENKQFALARSQSYGFFYDVTEMNWSLLRKIYREHTNHLNPVRPLMYNPHNEDKQGIETWGAPESFSSYKAWYQSVRCCTLCLLYVHYFSNMYYYYLYLYLFHSYSNDVRIMI